MNSVGSCERHFGGARFFVFWAGMVVCEYMDAEIQELKALMQQQIAIAADTNEKVRALHGAAQRAAFFRFIYWALIVGVTVWSFQYIAPYLQVMQKTYSTLQSALSALPPTK